MLWGAVQDPDCGEWLFFPLDNPEKRFSYENGVYGWCIGLSGVTAREQRSDSCHNVLPFHVMFIAIRDGM